MTEKEIWKEMMIILQRNLTDSEGFYQDMKKLVKKATNGKVILKR